ncbi:MULTISPECIES: ferritin-like domain-containing protein [Dickeya]|uniref:DUF2202 domain-containing protein n=1 Tax=Dickeya oryzae TaxID=1240404 RepID=A0AB39IM16_9GAMM|nr:MULTISPECIES: DUF2202 domain-containing protein [Dickeya]MBP2851086.1 DUF2202 domain-containing protein [Dickeya oryzae]MCA6991953.1 DUF2202 domain-containing protein [Dickeya oryzae]MCA6995178.1 DUF2202 domain-containing protein [Dickeya oryzae]UUE10189.1 DUF2202 domain-containing protein [Dickeya zeae]
MKSQLLSKACLLLVTLSITPLYAQQPLDNAAKNALQTALYHEYHTEALYAAAIEKFGQVAPFNNIMRAEQNHAHALAQLMQNHGMSVPPNTLSGSTEMKNTLPATLKEACKMGVDAEIANQALYDKTLLPAVSSHQDITLVFQRLRDASQQNHLPAFKQCQ